MALMTPKILRTVPTDIGVRSEISPLELVVTSPPGDEFDLMVPENLERHRHTDDGKLVKSRDYLLFDDLVLRSAMQSEHARLVDIIRAVTGREGHITWRQLLVETLGRPEARAEAIERSLALEGRLYGVDDRSLGAIQARLQTLDAPRLTAAFVTGRDPNDAMQLFRWPSPNALFARDLCAVAGDGIVLTYAAEPARGREMLLSRVIMRHHRLFRDVPKLDIGIDGVGQAGLSVEGGDIQVMSSRVAVIGVGIRTTLEASRRLAPLLLAQGFEVVLAYEMPRRRAAMHLDTLFTRIDAGHCLIYPPMVNDAEGVGAKVHRFTSAGHEEAGTDLLRALADVGVALLPVYCGGSDPIAQQREQWSDGANAFALAPGIIICYGRNPATLRELNRAGYEVVEPERFVDNALYYVAEGRKVVAALRGHELVRGRGGPRCLTMPLRRAF